MCAGTTVRLPFVLSPIIWGRLSVGCVCGFNCMKGLGGEFWRGSDGVYT